MTTSHHRIEHSHALHGTSDEPAVLGPVLVVSDAGTTRTSAYHRRTRRRTCAATP